MSTFVSLFRGINVGGKRIVPMKELKELYESLGFKNVVTYIQSGNVVCSSDDTDMALVSQRIEESFGAKFGFHSNVIVRTAAELQAIIECNPFQGQPAQEANRQLVLFLALQPASTALEDIHQAYSGPEELSLIGRELYIYYPNGVGRSKLTLTLLEKKLKTAGTGRNWNTVLQLHKLSQR
ncbi:MAG TPA: DUF1697 domain-containing protein [Ktedonosporobacter sp.]|jgi:uncharacterized protein (DUF1697 family)|nr:DUF1697 domain-containing protein [Ktedonosporobacter sp.]